MKKLIGVGLGASLLGVAVPNTWAADDTVIEEIVVTGIRGSLKQSLEAKRMESNSLALY